MSALEGLIYGYRTVRSEGSDVPERSKINFVGFRVADNPVTGATDIFISPSSSSSSASGSISSSLVFVNTGAGPGGSAIVMTLPASPALGDTYQIKRLVGNPTRSVSVSSGSNQIEQWDTDTLASSLPLESGDCVKVVWNGTYWSLIS